jgi:MFS family permease
VTTKSAVNAREAGGKPFLSVLGRPILVLLLLQLMGGMMLSPQRTFFPVYVKELGYPALLISTLATVRQAMGLLASLVGGSLSDLLGRKWTLLLGQIGFLASALIFVSPLPGPIAVLWALGGLGMGLHTLGGQSYLMDNAHPAYLGLLTAFYNWGYTLGGTLSSPVAGFLLDRWDYRVFGGALAILALGTIAANLTALPRSPVQGARPAAPWKKLFGYGDIAARAPVVLLVILRFLPTVYWGMALLLIPLLLDAAQASKTTIALYATVSQVIASLAQIVAGRAVDRFGCRWPTAVTFSVLVASALGTGVWSGRLWGIVTFGTLGAAAAWSLSTLLPSWAAQVAEPRERGRVLGWVHLWWNLAMIVGSMLGGSLFERWSGLPFLLAGALNVLAIAVAFAFFRTAAREKAVQAA